MAEKKLKTNVLRDWYKDAIIYEVHVKSFFDSNSDGIGDFEGFTGKLDYLMSLGVNTIWLLPYCPSPLKDDGYDISDYRNIHPNYGTLHDFRKFIREAHKRGIRVIGELVLNHTSDQHEWFQKSRKAEFGTYWKNFYVWSDTPRKYEDTRIIFPDFETSNWAYDQTAKQYYWHRFYSHQPDLNYDNPMVKNSIFRTVEFWFKLGLDGLRLDAVPYLYEREGTICENLPETFEFLKKLRTLVNEKFPDRVLLAEANQWPEDAVKYFGKGDCCHMAFHFPIMPRMFMCLEMEDHFPLIDILDQTPEIPESCQWTIFLRNHDELTLEMVTDEERDYMYRMFASNVRARINVGIRRRMAPLLRNNRRKIELMNFLLFSLPGSPVIYYGDEIGMGDNFYLGDRNGVRTPMQWSSDKNAGFSDANPHELYLPIIIEPEYHYEAVNVETQEKNPSSLLWWMRRTIAKRKEYKAFSRGAFHIINSDNSRILAFIREYEGEIILAVFNLSRFSQPTSLDLRNYWGYKLIEVFSRNEFASIASNQFSMTMGPFDFFWFEMKTIRALNDENKIRVPDITVKGRWDEILKIKGRQDFIKLALIPYLKRTVLKKRPDRKIQSMICVDIIPLSKKDDRYQIFMGKVSYNDGIIEEIMIPLFYYRQSDKEGIFRVKEQISRITEIDPVNGTVNKGTLVNGKHSYEFRDRMLEWIRSGENLVGNKGILTCRKYRYAMAGKVEMPSELLPGEHSSICFFSGEDYFIKLYSRIFEGINPEIYKLKFLTSTGFRNAPDYLSDISYQESGRVVRSSVGIIMKFVYKQKFAVEFFRDELIRFIEMISVTGKKPAATAEYIDICSMHKMRVQSLTVVDVIGQFFLQQVQRLGEVIAEMHCLMVSGKPADRNFTSESFNIHYQRSIYQNFRNIVRNGIARIKIYLDRNPNLGVELQLLMRKILESEQALLTLASDFNIKKIRAVKIQIHGNLTLRNIIYTGRDFFLSDFEGESDKSYSERMLRRSALRDISSLFYSFYYHCESVFRVQSRSYAGMENLLKDWTVIWFITVCKSFFSAYMEKISAKSLEFFDEASYNILFKAILVEWAFKNLRENMEKEDHTGIFISLEFISKVFQHYQNPLIADTM